jgi:hypothetical protein
MSLSHDSEAKHTDLKGMGLAMCAFRPIVIARSDAS